ncbi:hypothetical protein AMJ80_01640 [bacterium SM23_31]|nr:MAG: hypothetical protein AMJ80_01640 [bacterium SM23_31]
MKKANLKSGSYLPASSFWYLLLFWVSPTPRRGSIPKSRDAGSQNGFRQGLNPEHSGFGMGNSAAP